MRLEPKVMEVLVALAKRPGEVVGKEELISEAHYRNEPHP